MISYEYTSLLEKADDQFLENLYNISYYNRIIALGQWHGILRYKFFFMVKKALSFLTFVIDIFISHLYILFLLLLLLFYTCLLSVKVVNPLLTKCWR